MAEAGGFGRAAPYQAVRGSAAPAAIRLSEINSRPARTALRKASASLINLFQTRKGPEIFNDFPGGGPDLQILARGPALRTRSIVRLERKHEKDLRKVARGAARRWNSSFEDVYERPHGGVPIAGRISFVCLSLCSLCQ